MSLISTSDISHQTLPKGSAATWGTSQKGTPKRKSPEKMVHDNQEAFLLNFNANFEDRPNFSSRIYGKFSAGENG